MIASRTSRPPGGHELPEITPTELSERLERGEELTLVDVREPEEKEIADLPAHGQRLIPLGEFLDRADELDSVAPVVLYCRTGSRSGWATRQLVARGHERVWNLKGGLMGWRSEVDPTMREY